MHGWMSLRKEVSLGNQPAKEMGCWNIIGHTIKRGLEQCFEIENFTVKDVR